MTYSRICLRNAAARALLLVSANACSTREDLCHESVLGVDVSPDGSSLVEVIERDCGATTALVTVVRVVPTGRCREPAGDLLVVDDDHGHAPADARGAIRVRIAWHAPDRVTAELPIGARVLKRAPRIGAVSLDVVTRAGP